MGARRLSMVLLLGAGLVACTPESDTGGGGGDSGFGGTGGFGGSAGFGGFSGSSGFGGFGGYGGSGGGTGEACKAGHYIGEFTGKYRSTAWGNGEAANALDVMSQDDPIAMTVGLEFWLEASGRVCDPSDEFCGGFTVTGGKMRGNANAGLVAVPFEIDLTGDLDCGAGKFRGRLENGWYEVLGFARATFAGEIFADYDSTSSRFINGEWDVVEDVMPNLPWPPGADIGGEGNWSAGWVGN